jgi:hypothetical protein
MVTYALFSMDAAHPSVFAWRFVVGMYFKLSRTGEFSAY